MNTIERRLEYVENKIIELSKRPEESALRRINLLERRLDDLVFSVRTVSAKIDALYDGVTRARKSWKRITEDWK